MRSRKSFDRSRRDATGRIFREMRHEQLFWNRYRCKNIVRFPPQKRRTSRKMSITRQKLHVVWGVREQAMVAEDLQEFRAACSIGMRWTKNSTAKFARNCDSKHSKVRILNLSISL